VDRQYERFCAVDPYFYDALTSARPEATWFATARRPVPHGWQRDTLDDWLVYGPTGGSRPEQGWRVDVSACLDNAERVLDRVFGYCVLHRLPFKVIHGRAALLMRNAKYAHRGTSGRFITVYPRDDADLEIVCEDLGTALAAEPGPDILSDLRLGDGPVHVRYGGSTARTCIADGGAEPAVADPAGVPALNRRDPAFRTPPGVRLPRFLGPYVAARNASAVVDLPYRVDEVIHVSNGGGLYRGIDTRTGDRVVLKEARPHAGLDADGQDAIARLRREQKTLERLSDLDNVPRVHERFPLGEREFLALEYIDAKPLNEVLDERYPLIDADATADAYRRYSRWALHIYQQIERTIGTIHARGLVYGDLHLFNVMVRTDGPDADIAVLVDFEVAGPADGYRRPGLGNQGFAAPPGVTGPDVDRYALACLRLALFLPLTAMLRLAPEKARHFAAVIGEHFDVPEEFLSEAVATITARPGSLARAPDASGWTTMRRLTDAIVDSATPRRDDRLFPGDIEQFHSGGLNVAYGAAGVLYALAATGAGPFPGFEDWLIRRALRPRSDSRLGFYDGLHGVAYVLHELDRRQEALDVLDLGLGRTWDGLGTDLMSGLAGIGLNLQHLAAATGEPALHDAARRATDLVAERLGRVAAAGPPTGDAAVSRGRHPRAGLTHGWTGPALLFLRTYERTGDPAFLDRAVTALYQDLNRCVTRPDGALEVDEGRRTTPYLAQGSVGMGIVIDQVLAYRADERLADASAAISLAARSPFSAQSGLFAGRAGIIRYLAGHDRDDGRLHQQIRNLAWHAVPFRSGVAFPGEQLLRLSMDLATGSAGVLLALGAALHDRAIDLPFLGPAGPP
jgi:tRNA A-37 threonylcarbamoyl transferase component Bud32